MILRYVDDSFIAAGESLVRVGPVRDSGKTHISVAIGLRMVQRDYVVRFIAVRALLHQVFTRRDLEAR